MIDQNINLAGYEIVGETPTYKEVYGSGEEPAACTGWAPIDLLTEDCQINKANTVHLLERWCILLRDTKTKGGRSVELQPGDRLVLFRKK